MNEHVDISMTTQEKERKVAAVDIAENSNTYQPMAWPHRSVTDIISVLGFFILLTGHDKALVK